ncbi:MAG: hypothetical protein NTZ74_12380 [Chloroflexi bacterium]|nr:hypothetical protein [Chloroflexota bacterium]
MNLLAYIVRRFVPIGLVAGAGIFAIGAASPAATSRVEGIGVDLLGAPPSSIEEVETELNSIAQAGVKFVRIEMNWSWIESSPDIYNWSAKAPMDLFLSSASQRGIKTIAVLTGGPAYLDSSAGPIDETILMERWIKFVQAAVDTFGEQVDIWEIGYQINSSSGSSPFLLPSTPEAPTQPDPIFYTRLLKAASKIIKTGDPNDQVWIGSLISAAAGNCALNPLTYLLEINGAKGWGSADAFSYQPSRGATAPEDLPNLAGNQACASSIAVPPGNMSAEVQSMKDLSRQLGGKPLYITGLKWSNEDLQVLRNNRAIEPGQFESDLLVRASIMLMGNNTTPLIFWQIDPSDQWYAMTAMKNLNTILSDSKSIGQFQGQSGSVQEYRFQKAGDEDIIAWRSSEGDSPQPVTLSNLDTRNITAFTSDSTNLSESAGSPLSVDESGNTILLLNERPVIFLLQPGGFDDQIKRSIMDQTDLWKIDLQESILHWINNQKAAFLRSLDDLFNQAKENAINWGEQKINDLLN